MASFFLQIHQFINKNKALSVILSIFLLVVFGYFASKITFEEDITKVMPKSEQGDITTKIVQQLKFSDKITVLISKSESGSTDDLTQTAASFLDKLNRCDEYIKNVQGKVDESNIQETFDFVYNHLPLFLEDEDYQQIENKLNQDSITIQVENNLKTLISPTGIVAKDFIIADPMGISFMALKKLQKLNISDDFKLVNGYVVTQDEQSLLLFIDPVLSGSETEKNTDFVAKLHEIRNEINTEFSGKTNLDYFGSSLIAVANAKQIKSDILTTILVSMGVLMILLIIYYRKIYVPIIIFIPSVFGGLFALMCMYFLRDSISAISISIGAVLIGITIDYSLHILTHYKNNSSIELLFKDIVKPLIMSSTTNAVAFLCLLFVKSEALQDLGIFASIAIVMSAVFSIIIIPHLYVPKEVENMTRKSVLDRLASYSFEKNKVLIFGSLLLIGISLFTYHKVTFDNDLSKLNYIPDEIKQVEKQLENSTNLTSKSLYLVLYGEDKQEVLQKNAELKNTLENYKQNHEIHDFSSLSGIVLSEKEQRQKIEKWNDFWQTDRKENLKQNLIESGEKVGFKPETHNRFYALLNENPQTVSWDDYTNIPTFFTEEYTSEKDNFFTITSTVKVVDEKRADFIKSLSEKENEVIIIDRQQLNETFLGHLKDDFNRLINYSFV
ncbi:MAG TPA: MMPL family transporter, partial [Flavobacterium sp.]|nr:MMPL family transporter [Flavobacterium sp.]